MITETLDAHGFDAEGKQRARDPNPMSGPFFIEGAAAGDGLEVQIDRIDMNRATGWTRSGLAWHVVDPSEVRNMPGRDKITWNIDRNGQKISLEDAPGALKDWSTPLDPMIGCLGVAPAEGQFISTATSG
ncbi:MAG: acetamidase, partial [Devosia sp.]